MRLCLLMLSWIGAWRFWGGSPGSRLQGDVIPVAPCRLGRIWQYARCLFWTS
jgi:hypothetical protein